MALLSLSKHFTWLTIFGKFCNFYCNLIKINQVHRFFEIFEIQTFFPGAELSANRWRCSARPNHFTWSANFFKKMRLNEFIDEFLKNGRCMQMRLNLNNLNGSFEWTALCRLSLNDWNVVFFFMFTCPHGSRSTLCLWSLSREREGESAPAFIYLPSGALIKKTAVESVVRTQ